MSAFDDVVEQAELGVGDSLGVLAVGLFIVFPMAVIMNVMLKIRQWLGGD